jgi:hypothetical protein
MARTRYSGGDAARPRPDPAPAGMSGRSALVRGAAAVAVFAVAFAVGNALDEDERPAAPDAPARHATTPALGSLRLEPAPGLPGLRAVPAKPKPKPAAPAGPGPAAPADPVPDSEGVTEAGGYVAPTPTPPVSSPPPSEPAPAQPAPPSDPEPAPREVPQASAPTPDPAPIPAVPTPDPAPPGGYGPNQGP